MLEKLFEKINSELLTDDVKLELSTMFESAVNQAIEAQEEELEEANRKEIAEFKEELVEKVDEYITYFVEEFTNSNEQQIEESVKIQAASRVLSVFEGLVKDFNLQLDEQVVEENEELETLKAKFNEQTEKLIAKGKELDTLKMESVKKELSLGLGTDLEMEKFLKLADTIVMEGKDVAGYTAKLQIMVESVKGDKASAKQTLEESEEEGEAVLEERETVTSKYMKLL